MLSVTRLSKSVAIILLVHGLAGMFNNGINDFGNLYLNQVGFAPFGVVVAWLVKLSHVGLVISLLTDRYLKFMAITTILILIAGIIMIHFKEGWFVVGGGRNGMEFNFLLIMCLLAVLYPKSLLKNNDK